MAWPGRGGAAASRTSSARRALLARLGPCAASTPAWRLCPPGEPIEVVERRRQRREDAVGDLTMPVGERTEPIRQLTLRVGPRQIASISSCCSSNITRIGDTHIVDISAARSAHAVTGDGPDGSFVIVSSSRSERRPGAVDELGAELLHAAECIDRRQPVRRYLLVTAAITASFDLLRSRMALHADMAPPVSRHATVPRPPRTRPTARFILGSRRCICLSLSSGPTRADQQLASERGRGRC